MIRRIISYLGLNLFVILTRLVDMYFTYKYTPDLSNEKNPLVTIFGLRWKGIITIHIIGFIIIAYLSSLYFFAKKDILPRDKGLTFKEFRSYLYTGNYGVKHNWIFSLFSSRKKENNLYTLGWIIPVSLSIVGIIIFIMHLLLMYSSTYRNIHKYFIPIIYILIFLSVLYSYNLFARIQYTKYLKIIK